MILYKINRIMGELYTVNVIDDFNREGLACDVDLSLPASRVIRPMDQIIK